jgi:hypothetical protein
VHSDPLETTEPLFDVNRRCIAALVQMALADRPALTLVVHLKDLLARLTPAMHGSSALRTTLLTDMHLAELPWWRKVHDHPKRPLPSPSWLGGFPRSTGLGLARATMMLAWHSVRAAPQRAVLLGVTPQVAELLADFSLTELDEIAERNFRHVRPRWEDRPAVWRALLSAMESQDFRKARDFSVYSLQLMTGELCSAIAPRSPCKAKRAGA